VRAGDTVVARVEVVSIDERKGRVVLSTRCTVKDKVVIDGEATMKVSRRELAVASDAAE